MSAFFMAQISNKGLESAEGAKTPKPCEDELELSGCRIG